MGIKAESIIKIIHYFLYILYIYTIDEYILKFTEIK